MIRTGVLTAEGYTSICDHLCAEDARVGDAVLPLCGADGGLATESVSGTLCAKCAVREKGQRTRRRETPEEQRRADARIAAADAARERAALPDAPGGPTPLF